MKENTLIIICILAALAGGMLGGILWEKYNNIHLTNEDKLAPLTIFLDDIMVYNRTYKSDIYVSNMKYFDPETNTMITVKGDDIKIDTTKEMKDE